MKLVLKLALLVLVAQDIAICGAKQSIVHRSSGSNVDYNTFSNFLEVKTLKYYLEWYINFDSHIIYGNQTLEMQAQTDLSTIYLDVWDLAISQVLMNGYKVQFQINDMESPIGAQLQITVGSKKRPVKRGTVINITIGYHTSPDSSAISFLTPEQTSSKTLPYIFTQCESIYCRSLAPLQDTPQIKSPYHAEVTVADPIMVYMSANLTACEPSPTLAGHTTYTFDMDIPIPSYLLAIVAGNIVSQKIDSRTYVISEPTDIERYAAELSELGVFLDALEEYILNYVWGTYKIVILPPSFPFGGMENPLLTFASPSIIVGDKSGVTVAIHEIAHSWTGNLVTCANWTDFWLNEGFTVFLERKINQILYGDDLMNIQSINGNTAMVMDMKSYGMNHTFSSLHPEEKGINPDDAFSDVPYEKGFQFLYFIEGLIGESNQKYMLQNYTRKFAYQSIGWSDFRDFFEEWVTQNIDEPDSILQQIDWFAWIFAPGLPPIEANFTSASLEMANSLAEQFIDLGGKDVPRDWRKLISWQAEVKYIFVNYLLDQVDRVTENIMKAIDECYNFTFSTNMEILVGWYQISILVKYKVNWPLIDQYLGEIGRMKLVVPIYQSFVDIGQRDYGISLFNKYRDWYHPVTRLACEKALQIPNKPHKRP